MFQKALLTAFTFSAVALGQLVGTYQTETHPKLPFQRCTKNGGCTTVSNGQVVLDSNWRWIHHKDGYTNCYTGNAWNTTVCPDPAACAKNCALDGADYSATYGITTSGNALTLKFVTTNTNGKNIGSRVYLMSSDTKYEMFKLMNQEFTMDVDTSNLPCGLNGAVYFSEMAEDGGTGKYSSNKAGAKYGTGYCDSQCPKDIKWINGEVSLDHFRIFPTASDANDTGECRGWNPSDSDPNGGTGKYGTCCNEMDIWEANKISTAYTPHPCRVQGPYRCSDAECNTPTDRYGGVCDPDGCDYNSYRMGVKDFYGPGMTVDTNKKFTVVTQFISDDGTANGNLKEIRRIYVQDGKVIQNSKVNIPDMTPTYDSITANFCFEQKGLFGDRNSFQDHGGITGMDSGVKNGMVLALSIWDDHHAHMLWLDSSYPTDADPNKPGIARGSCPTDSGDPKKVEADSPNASVTYSNIKIGDIGSTFGGSGTTNPGGTTTSQGPAATQTKWGQCGGRGWTGPTACENGTRCVTVNEWYSQCQ